MTTPLITAHELHERLTHDPRPVVLDVRWALGDPHGREHFAQRRIPGSRYVDLDSELAAPPTARHGRHPLPKLEDLQAAARRWGVRQGEGVVVLDDNGSLAAARAWWLLTWAGVADVRVLDGGLGAWQAAGFELAEGPTEPDGTVGGDVTLTSGRLPTLEADQAAALARTGVLLDARAAERYRGESEPIDPRAGHIPGAVCAPTAENLAPDATFQPADRLRARFARLGVPRAEPGSVGVYCGSGVTAAHQILALRLAGLDAALYPGSWSQWSSDPDRPIAVGAEPGNPPADAGPADTTPAAATAGPGTDL